MKVRLIITETGTGEEGIVDTEVTAINSLTICRELGKPIAGPAQGVTWYTSLDGPSEPKGDDFGPNHVGRLITIEEESGTTVLKQTYFIDLGSVAHGVFTCIDDYFGPVIWTVTVYKQYGE